MPFPRFGADGIDQLTADVTAGPGFGSQPATLVLTANVQDLIDDEIENLVLPANGYGITGNTGLAPTPAVGLTNVTSFLSATQSLLAGTQKNITSVSLAAGTWLVMCQICVANTSAATAANLETGLSLSSAAGAALAGAVVELSGTTALGGDTLAMSFFCVVVAATPTSYYLNAECSQVATVEFQGVAFITGTGFTGITAVRIA